MAVSPLSDKQRVHAALAGKPLDRFPVTSLYNQLYHLDHFDELTGRPQWEVERWLHSEPAAHVALFGEMLAAAPFELLQPQSAPPRETREHIEFVVHDGVPCRRDRRSGELAPLVAPRTGHAHDYHANETQFVFDRHDVDARLAPVTAEEQLATGANDFLDAAVAAYGADHFIVAGGVCGVLYLCGEHVGLTNLFGLMLEDPALIEYLSARLLEQSIETIRRFAAAGADAIYLDDALATNDMISVAHYERFCLPAMREMVREVQRLGHRAILIYFGGIADRLEQIASLGADGLSMETSMKGYVNDVAVIAAQIGDRVSLFGNIDPVGVLQSGGGQALEGELARQAAAGRTARGFIHCTGSPITPATPLRRVQQFIELSKQHGVEGQDVTAAHHLAWRDASCNGDARPS